MIHANSLDAYYNGKHEEFTKRQLKIMECFYTGAHLTDRRCMNLLGFSEPNAVRPRITELIDRGVLQEVATVICPVTKKRVRVCGIAPRKPADYLPGFNLGGVS